MTRTVQVRGADGFHLGDKVVDRHCSVKTVMSVAGVRNTQGGRAVLCTWTEADGQAYHEWIPEGSLEMHRDRVPVPSTAAPVRHVRCGEPVGVLAWPGGSALHVWCETCREVVGPDGLCPQVRDGEVVRLRVEVRA